MGKQKVQVSVIGFEKRFTSMTEAREELAVVWPATAKILGTELGKSVLRYSVLKQDDETFEADLALLRASGNLAIMDGKTEAPIARLVADHGKVCFITWFGAGFGWEPTKTGGFLAFMETWPTRYFKKGKTVEPMCDKMGWRRVLETPMTVGLRRMGDVSDLERILNEDAKRMAAINGPERLVDAASQGPSTPPRRTDLEISEKE